MGVVLLTLVLAGAALTLEFTTSPESVLDSSYEEFQGLRDHEKDLGTFEHRLILVVHTADVFRPEFLELLSRATESVKAEPSVLRVRSLVAPGFPLPDRVKDPDGFRRGVIENPLLSPFLVSADASTAALWVDVRTEADASDRREESVRRILAAARKAGLDPLVSGVPAVRIAYATHIREDLFLLPPLVTLILLVLLTIAFRRLVLVIVPLLVVGLASLWTIGVLALTGGRISALTSILPSLVLVVGTATAIHVVARFRESLHRGLSSREAARDAMRTMFLPCGLTALTTAVGFSSLSIARIHDVQQFGLYSAVGALFAFLLGVPLTGVLLSFGREAASRPGLGGDRALRGLSRWLLRRPLLAVLSGVALALASAGGLARIRNETFMLEDVRKDAPIHRATKAVDEHLGGVIGFDVVIRSEEGVLETETLGYLRHLEERLGSLAGVRAVVGPWTLLDQSAKAVGFTGSTEQSAAMLLEGIRTLGGADAANAIISTDGRLARVVVRTGDVGSVRSRELREAARKVALVGKPASVNLQIAGLTVLAEEVLGRLVMEMARSTAIAFVVIFLLLSLLFRSLRLGALSMVPNFLPLFVAGGFMGFAGITIRSSIALIFAVALGIAVDDTIHLLTRYRRERERGRGPRPSVFAAIRWTGRPVVLTSTVLFFGFLAFTLSDFKATMQFGLIAAVTIASALVGDLFLLPGLLLCRRAQRRSRCK